MDVLLPEAVERVLKAVEDIGRDLPPSQRDNFAFNVHLNALATVLEALRAREPEEYRSYQEMAVLTLRDAAGVAPGPRPFGPA
jgi:hypothetical protein